MTGLTSEDVHKGNMLSIAYGMYESVTQMLEELTWVPLSKRRENARLILFYKIINNLAMVPHSCLEKADGHTRKNHNLKFRHIGYNVDPYGQSFFPKCISAWNGLAQEIAEANTLDLFIGTLDPTPIHQQSYS